MKHYIEILLKNNSILRKRIDNPSDHFNVDIKVDGKKDTTKYFYRKEKSFERKGIFFKHRVSFYEYGNPEPLDPKFNSSELNMKQFQSILENKIIEDLGASVKNKEALVGMTTGAIIGVCAIIGIVIIVLVG